MLVSKRKQLAPSDQVIIELPPYCGPRSPLDLIAVEFIFGFLFEVFRHTSQALGPEHRLRLTPSQSKNLGHCR
jgi:hypothetical protein